MRQTCPICFGLGYTNPAKLRCARCRGRGWVRKADTISRAVDELLGFEDDE